MSDITDQPPPKKNDGVPVWEKVIEDYKARFGTGHGQVAASVLDDMAERDAVGRKRYGTPLQTLNGRDQLVDAYQEMLDAAVYTKAAILEGIPLSENIYINILSLLTMLRIAINARTGA